MSMQAKIEGQREMEALFSKPETQAAFDGSAEAEKAIRIAKAHADAMALRYIAECECPDDLKQWAINNKIPTFAEVTWQAGFVQGWRMSLVMQSRALEDRGNEAR